VLDIRAGSFSGAFNDNPTSFGTTAAIAVAMAFTVAATTAQADDCDDIMDALKKLGERVMNYKDDAKTPLAVCGAVGQVLGILKASREAAAECYDEGDKRSKILLDLDKVNKEMESQVDSLCK
jgi:hypothetical protein